MFKRRNKNLNRQKGLSLIEMMLGISISSILITSLTAIYLAAEKSQETQLAINTMQENSRIATQFLSAAIHTSGFIGCAYLTDQFPLTNNTEFSLNADNKIVADSDGSFTIWRINSMHALLAKNMQGYATLYASADVSFSKGDIILISNCKTADVVEVKTVVTDAAGIQKITTQHPLAIRYDENSLVSKLEINTYFVDKTSRQTKTGSPVYALFVKDIHQRKTELVEGIEDMQVNIVTNATGVKAGVSIMLSLSSLNNNALHTQWPIYVALGNGV